jgi:hypothetical protein
MGRSVWTIPLPHHRGTPARRAINPGMHIPRLAREAGLARGCDEEEERIHYYPVNIRNRQVPGEPLAPHTGYSFGAAAPQTTCWRQGLRGPPHGGTPSSAPLPLRTPSHEGKTAEGRRLALPPTR